VAAFDLGRFAGPAPLVVAKEVLSEPMGPEQRRQIWQTVGLRPALTVVAGLFADLDLAVITNQRSAVEMSFISGVDAGLRKSLEREIARGRAVFSNTGLVQSLKELLEFADEESLAELSASDLTRCVLGISQEQDSVDADLLARVLNPDKTTLQTMLSDYSEAALDWTAQHLFDYSDPFEIVAGDVDEIWRRGWSPRTDPAVVATLGGGPADVFAATYGIELDDFQALGWALWAQARFESIIGFNRNALVDLGMSEDVINVFVKTCSVPLDELRDAIKAERTSPHANIWTRYVLQSAPFLRFSDGSFLMLRLQYGVQRMFGDLLALKLYEAVKATDAVRASHFKAAMNDIFEFRVGEALHRIAKHEERFGGAVIIDDPAMRAAWSTKKGQHKKICDFVYCQRKECIVIDANNRNVPQQFAERFASGADLVAEIREMFAAGKFVQLTSTVEQFRSNGWTTDNVVIDGQSKFIPLVVAPNAGMPTNEFTEMLVLQHALPMITAFDSKALPPTIITWRDLRLLEGFAEAGRERIIDLLIKWRISNYLKVTRALGLPAPLSDFVADNYPVGLPLSRQYRQATEDCWARLRKHALHLITEAEQGGH
jgi:hypothetical protein